MARILAIDYGLKRCGLAVTDPLKIIATALETVDTHQIINYLQAYFKAEQVEAIIMGLPIDLRSQDTDVTANVRAFEKVLKSNFPEITITLVDERFTSKIASHVLANSGMKKKQRQQKGQVDKIAAVIILQSYLGL